MHLQEQYLEITFEVSPSATFFGLGERTSSTGLALARSESPLTLWNRDQPSRFADQNLYGSYPFLLQLEKGAPLVLPLITACLLQASYSIPSAADRAHERG